MVLKVLENADDLVAKVVTVYKLIFVYSKGIAEIFLRNSDVWFAELNIVNH